MNDKIPYPRNVRGGRVQTPLAHLALYGERGRGMGETYIAVPVELLLRASKFRECQDKCTFTHDEDGELRVPFEAACRMEQGHDNTAHPVNVRKHSNGYYSWSSEVQGNA